MTETTQERWERGSATELRFWADWIALNGKNYLGPTPLADYVANRIPSTATKVRIADLGAGAWSRIGTIVPGVAVEVVAADIFANEYMAVWSSLSMRPEITIEKQNMTALTYPDNSFDIVHCSNALDHTVNPFRAIFEMKRVLKPGGWLLLRHYKSVGQQYRYYGLHQWNFTPKGDDVLIWSDHATEHHYLSEFLPGVIYSMLSRETHGKPQRLCEWRKPNA